MVLVRLPDIPVAIRLSISPNVYPEGACWVSAKWKDVDVLVCDGIGVRCTDCLENCCCSPGNGSRGRVNPAGRDRSDARLNRPRYARIACSVYRVGDLKAISCRDRVNRRVHQRYCHTL